MPLEHCLNGRPQIKAESPLIGQVLGKRLKPVIDIENIVVDQLSQTLISGNQIQSMLLDGSYTSEQLHNVISRCNKLATEIGAAKYARKQEVLRNLLDRIDLHDDRVVIRIDNRSLLNVIRADSSVQPSS